MRIAINGLGRIGRNFLRVIMEDSSAKEVLDIVAINIGPANPDAIAYMFEYDTLMGTYPGTVTMKNGKLVVDDHAITILDHLDPLKCDWGTLDIDWVVDASGKFTHAKDARKHIEAGAKAVLITAPAKGEDVSIIPGVNEKVFDKKKDKIVSLGSCTTNAFVTILKVLHDAFTITQGFMTTVHAYTNSQVLLDVNDSDLRRSRAAALNIIPTTTGASKVLGKILPDLDGAVQAVAIRVPVAKVSLIDLSFCTKKKLSIDNINEVFEQAATGHMQGIIGITHQPLVSCDFAGNEFSAIIDGLLTAVQGDMGKVFGWYDNEWAYCVRLKDFLLYVREL